MSVTRRVESHAAPSLRSMIQILIALLLGTFAALLVLRGTIFLVMYSERWMTYGRPKVFPRPRKCPRCDNRIGRFDRPRSLRQLLLGGWSCRACGSEFDQLNNCRIARAWNAHLRDLTDRSEREAVLEASRDPRSPVQKVIDE